MASPESTEVLTGQETQVTSVSADQFDPVISGDIVVYTDFSGVDADVWYTDLATGVAHPVSIAPGEQQLTSVSGRRVVYTDWNTMDVMLFDINTGVTENLTETADADSRDPSIDGTLVAWMDLRDGNSEIYARDLATSEERRITASLLSDEAPAVGDGLIAWHACQGFSCDVFVYDWATNGTTQLTATPSLRERFPDVSGRHVVFQREHVEKDDAGVSFFTINVVAYNLDTSVETELVLAGNQDKPHIDGDFVSFNDSSSGVPHAVLWRLSTGALVTIGTQTSGQYLNDISGNRVVYSDNRAGHLDIYMYEFQFVPDDPDPPTPPDPQAQLQALADLVASLNLKRGIENSLDAKLDAALAALEAARAGAVGTACNLLGAFMNEVDAQTGKAITVEDAAALKSAAAAIRLTLGCS